MRLFPSLNLKFCLGLSDIKSSASYSRGGETDVEIFYPYHSSIMSQNGDHEMTDAAAGAEMDAPVKVEKQRLRLVSRDLEDINNMQVLNSNSCLDRLIPQPHSRLRKRTTLSETLSDT